MIYAPFLHFLVHASLVRYPRFPLLSGRTSLPLAEAADGVEGALLPVGALPLQVPYVGVVSEALHHLLGEQVVDEGGVQGPVVVHQLPEENTRSQKGAGAEGGAVTGGGRREEGGRPFGSGQRGP